MMLLAHAGSTGPTEAYLAEISREFTSGSLQGLSLSWLMAAAGLVLLTVASASLISWWRRWRSEPSPLGAFHVISGLCSLSLGDRLLLWRIARQQRLPSPLALLLSPTTLHHHARAYAASWPAPGRAAVMRRVARLRRRAFAG